MPQNSQTHWSNQLTRIFEEMDRRKTVAAQSQPVSEGEFRAFLHDVVVPAFQLFHQALLSHGDEPTLAMGDDWVGLRWQDGHVIAFNALQRAPNRAASLLDRVRAHRERRSESSIDETNLDAITSLHQEDILRWLVQNYASYRRVSESELDYPAEMEQP